MNKVRVITDENKIKQMIKKVSAVGIGINVALVEIKGEMFPLLLR